MRSIRFKQLEKRQLKLILAGFFLALIIPTGFLVYQAYDQIKWEAYHQQRQLAEEVATRINNAFIELINIEEGRAFTDYSFLNVAGDPEASFLQRSPLTKLNNGSDMQGIIGYFQVDNQGRLTTPLLPTETEDYRSYGIPAEEFKQRTEKQLHIYDILKKNQLIKPERKALIAKQDEFSRDNKPAPEPTRDKIDNETSSADTTGGLFSSNSERATPKEALPASAQTPQPEPVTKSESTTLAPQPKSIVSEAEGQAAASQSPTMARLDSDARVKAKQDTTTSMTAESAAAAQKSIAAEQDQVPSESLPRSYGFDDLEKRNQSKVATSQEKQSPYSLGKVEDIQLEEKLAWQQKTRKKSAEKQSLRLDESKLKKKQSGKRTEQNVLPKQQMRQSTQVAAGNARLKDAPITVEIFKSEIDPFDFNLLESGQFVLHRKVWRNKQRYIQGILIDAKQFLDKTVQPIIRNSSLSEASNLTIAYNGDVYSVFRAGRVFNTYRSSRLQGALLYRTRLSPPLNDVELIFSIESLPAGPGGRIITWTTLVLLVILCGGFLLIYRLGLRQIRLARQQQDFVSAVSHELKTPLTSIRMYGEMLREGWASEEKKKSYYDYIYYESERLSRLIQNILQLARMTRNEFDIELHPVSVAELIDTIRSKISSQLERNQFTLNLNCAQANEDLQLNIDLDHFSQIVINLVDNGIKFAAKADKKIIDVDCTLLGKDQFQISIRDYGPGIAKDQLKKIFTLFYRTENELTRKTVGTGIGLALVHQLTHAMHGEIDVVNHEPGAEFRLTFPLIQVAIQ